MRAQVVCRLKASPGDEMSFDFMINSFFIVSLRKNVLRRIGGLVACPALPFHVNSYGTIKEARFTGGKT